MNEKLHSENFLKEKSHFLNLFSLALADNSVEPSELEVLYNVGLEHNFEKSEIDYLIDNPHKVKFNPPDNKQDIARQLYDLAKLLIADGKIDVREISSLKTFCHKVGISANKTETIISLLIDEVKSNNDKQSIISNIINQLEG